MNMTEMRLDTSCAYMSNGKIDHLWTHSFLEVDRLDLIRVSTLLADKILADKLPSTIGPVGASMDFCLINANDESLYT